jgi:hypothetical protein
MSSILKNANDLKKISISRSDIDIQVKDILYLLKTEIDAAVNNKKDSIVYKLPTQFALNVAGITIQELRTIIYYNIVKELEENDYEIKLKINTQKDVIEKNVNEGAFIQISWKNVYKDIEVADMREYLSTKII